MSNVVVRFALPGDLPDLRSAMVELQEHERRLAATRLPGEQIAAPYLARLQREAAEKRGAIFVVESDGVFAGFAAGWIIERDHIPETETRTASAISPISASCRRFAENASHTN